MSNAFNISLTQAQQVPTVNDNRVSQGTGVAIYDNLANTLAFTIVTTGVDWTTFFDHAVTPVDDNDVLIAHFHSGARGTNGGVVFDWGIDDTDDFRGIRNPDGSWTVSGKWETTDPGISINTFAAVFAAGVANQDITIYANVHTLEYGGGEIRGQLVGSTATDGVDFINGGANSDVLAGLGGTDIIYGFAGNDIIIGGLGNDTIYGDEGRDIAVLAGNRSAYSVTRSHGTPVVSGPDGSDTLFSIEALKFDDGIMSLAARSDFNGDRNSDILFVQPGATFNSIYQWQFHDHTLQAQGGVDLYDKAFSEHVIGDFDGDGQADLLFRNPTTGGVWEWQLNGMSIVSQGAVDVADPTFHLLGAADFDGNGSDDLLFRNDAGIVYMWKMSGLVNTPVAVGPLDPSWHVQGAGDFDGDGKADILLRNVSNTADSGAFFLWRMDGNKIIGQGGIERPGTDWVTLGTGDFDGDGKTDFAVRHVSNLAPGEIAGAVWVYLMNGTTIKAQGAAGIADASQFHVQAIGDLHGDGKDDILFRNDAGFFYAWDMDGTSIGAEGPAGTQAGNFADPALHVVTPLWDLV